MGRPKGSKNKKKTSKSKKLKVSSEVQVPPVLLDPNGTNVATGQAGVTAEPIKASGKAPKAPSGFNILQRGPKMREALREALVRGEKEARLIVGDPNKDRLIIPVLPFQMQAALKARGFLSATITEIIGPESVGKTTLKNTLYGWGLRHNCPIADFESEAKPMLEDRVRQCLHWDKSISRLMYDTIYRNEVHDIVSMIDAAEAWLVKIRDPRSPGTYVPLHIPAIIGVDSWSKLMDPGESESFAAYGGPAFMVPKKTGKPAKEKSEKTKAKEAKEAKKEAAKIKEIGSVSNLGSAKMASAWTRRLPYLLTRYNAMVIVTRHQMIKIEMAARPGGSFIAPEDLAPFNNNSRGGRAFPQSAAYEFILTPSRQIKRVISGQDTVIGHDVKVNVNKNSFGPSQGKFQYRINTAAYRENAQFQEMALSFAPTLPDMLKSVGLDVVRYSDDDFSCASLGVDRATTAEFEAAFHKRGDIVEDLGRRLQIKGYAEDMLYWPTMNPAFEPAATTNETATAPVELPAVDGAQVLGAERAPAEEAQTLTGGDILPSNEDP